MPTKIEAQAELFARSYAALFSSPDACSSDHVAELAKEIGTYYRPGMTMFTNGRISRFESQQQARDLIEAEMRENIASGLGTKLVLERIEKIEAYSETSALCWLRWAFHPQAGSEFEGKGWEFTNVYGYRSGADGKGEGWESVLRDQEVNEVMRVTGKSFES